MRSGCRVWTVCDALFCVVAQEARVAGCLLMKQQAWKGDRNEKKASMFAFFHFGSLRLLERVCSCLCASVAISLWHPVHPVDPVWISSVTLCEIILFPCR